MKSGAQSATGRGVARVLAMLLLVAAAAPGTPDVRARQVQEPAAGVLLVAAEGMVDPRFRRSVVLLLDHDHTGSWGLIVNKPTDISVGDVLASIARSNVDAPVHFGGPVHTGHLIGLFGDDAQDGSPSGVPGIRWSESTDAIAAHVEKDAAHTRVFAGYAGWSPGQLAHEIAIGGWRMVEGRRRDVLSREPERLWERLTNALEGIEI